MMKRVEGSAGVKLVECTNPVNNKWRVRWDVHEKENGTADYMEAEFYNCPSEEDIKSTVMSWYNDRTDKKILSGFVYENHPVWLSSENQFNYKSAHDLAFQTQGASLPVTFKFGTDTEPVYRTFETLAELSAFYTAAMSHIQSALAEGWRDKDAFNIENYRIG